MKMLASTLVSVRNGLLWNVTRNLLRTTSLKFLSALESPGLGPTRMLSEESLMKPQRQKQRCSGLFTFRLD